MITFSSRFLAVLLIAVVGMSLAGSMAGYALGTRGQRAGMAEALAPTTTASGSEAPAEAAPPAAELPAPQPVSQSAQPSRPARIADTPATTGLPLGSTAARGGVAVTMTDAQVSVWEQGLEVRLWLNNTSGSNLDFLFTPEQQLRLEDNRGVHWNMRWAEYEGEVSLPNGEKRQLVRALYHGELHHPGVDTLTLILRGAPELEEASWTFPAPQPPDTALP